MLKLIPLILLLTLGSFLNLKAQHGFNINLPIGIDTTMDIGLKVIQTKKHEFLACGVSNSVFVSNNEQYLVKTDSLGNVIWKKQYDISVGGSYDFFVDLVELPDSNYLLAGITTNTLTNDDDGFLAKIDTGGNIIWLKKYIHPDDDEITAMRLTPDGKIILLGYTFSSGTYSDVLLIKTDINGNLIWRKRFGNTYDEIYYSIEVIKNNTEYLLGGKYGYSSGGTDYYDMSLMRTDTAGNIIWQQQYGTTSGDEHGGVAISTLDSGAVICGIYNDSAAILKVNKYGIQQWIKYYEMGLNSFMRQVIQLKDSTFAMISSSFYPANNSLTGYLIKADKNGNMLWKRVYPASANVGNFFYGFNTTADKGFIITGEYNRIGQPYQNMWLVKTDSLGCDSVTCNYLTGMEEQNKNTQTIKLIPNPNDGNFTLLMNKEVQDLSLIVYDVTGKEVCSNFTSNTNNIQLNCTDLKNGIYIVKVFSNSVYLQSHKLVIQK